MRDVYDGRGQTAAKHFILRRYLQALAFKLLHAGFDTLSYVDGFSGPWESQTEDHSDTSFMIAIGVLKEAQRRVAESNPRPTIKCFFAEKEAGPYGQLHAAVTAHHDPANGFFIETHHGPFDDAVDDIMRMVGASFALTFIDPTGWTGYEFPKIQRLLSHPRGEVLVNYMKPFIDRFSNWDAPQNAASFNGIFGLGWQDRLDRSLPKDQAAYALFAEQFRTSGKFKYVVATRMEKDEGQKSFSIVYGTRSHRGLEAYRDAEYDALKNQGRRRSEARKAQDEAEGRVDMFADTEMALLIERRVTEACRDARAWLLRDLKSVEKPRRFLDVWPPMLANFTIRKTNAKDICVALANEGTIEASWRGGGSRRRKPDDTDLIEPAK
jgi:three-Cys-motif partner protein